VESVESQKQASLSFHEPLGNLAKERRDSHIPTAPTTTADGKVENQKQVSRLSHRHCSLNKGRKSGRGLGFALRPAADAPRRLKIQM
jgi:hypothetical protein